MISRAQSPQVSVKDAVHTCMYLMGNNSEEAEVIYRFNG